MKILLEECLPIDFRHRFLNYEAHTTEWAGFKGKKNSELLQAAETAGSRMSCLRSTRDYLTNNPLAGSSQSF